MRRAALTITFAAAVAAMGLAPSWASGAAGTLPDQNFAAGTFASTEVVAPNAVRLTIDGPVIEFETQPDDWLVDAWETGGNATFDGVLTVDGAVAYQESSGTAGQVLETTATFAAVPFQNLGFATDFNAPPWAMFSTGDGADLPVGLYARTNNGAGVVQNTSIAGVVATEPHDYRIEWDTGEIRFFVDGVLVATQAVAFTAERRGGRRVCYPGASRSTETERREMEQHRIVGPARGEPRPAGEVGARVRVPLSGTPSARWAAALRSHLTGALAGHSHVGHVRLNRLVQGATVVIEGVEPEEAERLGPVLQHAVAEANRTAGPHPDAETGGPNMPQARADEIAALVRVED